jgi:hypothetical protein
MKNKKILIVVGVLLSIILLQTQVEAQAVWIIKRFLYSYKAVEFGTEGWGELRDNISDIILANPSIDDVRGLMEMFLKLAFILYIPAIISIGVYLLFLSTSHIGRAQAKDILCKLVIGLIAVSISPRLIELLLTISSEFTSSILAFTETGIYSAALSDSLGGVLPLPKGLIGLHLIMTFVSIELGFYLFLFLMILVWGSFIFPIVLRFFIVSLFIALFPFSIFLYSFEFTRALGRMMVEQTIIWTFLQAVNALVVLTVVLCITSLPPDFMKVTMFLPNLIFVIASFMFPIAPLFIIRFFRGFLP